MLEMQSNKMAFRDNVNDSEIRTVLQDRIGFQKSEPRGHNLTFPFEVFFHFCSDIEQTMISVHIACNRRCSVYLNNVGCSLMKRGAFDDAMKTFSDAVLVMKLGVTPFTTKYSHGIRAPVVSVDSRLDLGNRIKRADQRMALHQASKLISSSTPDVFEILELADFPEIDLDELLCEQDRHLICPICIEPDLALSTPFDNMELISGIMMFNLGLAYSCLAKCDPILPTCQELRAAATRIFQLADCIVNCMLTDEKAMKIMNQEFEMWKVGATTAMAVLHSLFQVFADHCGSDDCILRAAHKEVYRRISFLQDYVYIHESNRFGGLQIGADGNPAASA
jgi:hypothetical protein